MYPGSGPRDSPPDHNLLAGEGGCLHQALLDAGKNHPTFELVAKLNLNLFDIEIVIFHGKWDASYFEYEKK